MALKKQYVYDTHVHTCEASGCAVSSGEQMAKAYHKAGYSGIIITNHFYQGNTCVSRRLPWEEWVEKYCRGYENAKHVGDKIGLSVFFGWESCYDGTEFLVYGLTKEWLLSHPEIKDATVKEQMELVHADGGMVIHAHPFREESYIPEIRLFPQWVDGVEVVNATHTSPYSKSHKSMTFNKLAEEYANEHHLLKTAGSDQHGVEMLWGGMIFDKKLDTIEQWMEEVRKGSCRALLDGTERDKGLWK